jgi:hypothetical protein
MTDIGFKAGDHVGIKDAPEFTHWSRRGAVTGPAEPIPGHPHMVNVVLDGGNQPIPMLAEVLVKLESSWDEPHSDEWFAQAFPMDGDAPGPKMYFATARDVLAFVGQFQSLKLDEIIKVHAPGKATEAERAMLRAEGAVEF